MPKPRILYKPMQTLQEQLLCKDVCNVAREQLAKLADWKARSGQLLQDFETQKKAPEQQTLSLPYDAAELKVLQKQVSETVAAVRVCLPKAVPKKRAADGENSKPAKRQRGKAPAVGGA